ncbi:MAG TPA: zf-HC2 domain-containing protein [Pseudonocardiaceae bacterium]|nr:zf-HC2 domain-containing protein [Pseudonocardiaceae bacterium]
MDCAQCREALSARLDGEESAAERDAIEEHLTGCAVCRRFADDAARVTRLARTAAAAPEPDVVAAVLAAAPRSRRPRLIRSLRVLLGVVGLAQAELGLAAMLGAHTSGHAAQGVVMQGASVAHFAHESAAWNLALGVGFLWVAWRSSRPSGMVPTLATFVTALTVLVVVDAMAGGVDTMRLLAHGLVVLGLILVIMLDRLPRPAGDTAPRIAMGRPRWLPPQRKSDPAVTGGDGPPGLRPTAQYEDTTIARRRSA